MATISRALDDGGWITLGRLEDTVVFGEGEPNETTLVAGSVNGFLARFAADGTLQWVQHLLSEGGTVETFWALEQDAGDSVLVGGKASRTVVFDPTGKPTEYDFGIDGRFVVRYGLDGAFRGVVLHSSEEETNPIEYVYSLAVHPDGGFVVSGGYDGSSVLSHEEVPACPPSSTGCGFLSRFDADDQPLWVRTIESGSSDGLARVFVLPGGDVLLGGWVCSSVFPEASCEQVVYGVGTPDAVMESTDNGLKTGFVSRWDGANGDLQWVRQLHGDRSSVWGLAADGDDLYVCGTFDGEAVYGAGEPWAQTLSGDQDLYIMKITD